MRRLHSHAPIDFVLEKAFRRNAFRPVMNSNNSLAVKPERENDPAREDFLSAPAEHFTSAEATAPARPRQGFFQMIKMLSRTAALFASTATVIFAVAMPAFSQAPTDAQRSAIRSECRSDYEAHCASIPPGGAASLQCLQKNMSSLSSSCQTAVRAVEAPAASTAEPAPAAAPPKAEAAPAAATAKPAAETAAPKAAESTA